MKTISKKTIAEITRQMNNLVTTKDDRIAKIRKEIVAEENAKLGDYWNEQNRIWSMLGHQVIGAETLD